MKTTMIAILLLATRGLNAQTTNATGGSLDDPIMPPAHAQNPNDKAGTGPHAGYTKGINDHQTNQ